MSRRVAALALVVVVVLAGCGGPGTENETTTGANSDGTPAMELPPNETVAEGTTMGTATQPSSPDALYFSGSPDP